ncbi:MAG: prepilin-type N-terminal cleavage/methylation domain-containing protein [Phycisphaerales bacterium]|nr:MAG: prepilin-type N-terminal cleavage/methylation domain-containing protein [Phycisphaerales bacterium]
MMSTTCRPGRTDRAARMFQQRTYVMYTDRTTASRGAFTLIEILVVVTIIGLLVAVLLPAFGTVRTKAQYAQANAQFGALDTGLEMFRGEADIGGTYPPSASDNPTDRQLIANPKGDKGDTVRISGAHLLVHAMLGADFLGTPGFRDFDRDGQWWNDTYGKPEDSEGAYALSTASGREGQEIHTRYGGAGYVDEKMRDNAKSFRDLVDNNLIHNLDCSSPLRNITANERVFLDPWGTPILYYKANPASLLMTTSADASGIYSQEDNGIITGTKEGPLTIEGLNFGSGKIRDKDRYHAISVNISPAVTEELDDILEDPNYEDSFARFILDTAVPARPTPVRKDSYLLISAGPDAYYGTEDDATNWTRKAD